MRDMNSQIEPSFRARLGEFIVQLHCGDIAPGPSIVSFRITIFLRCPFDESPYAYIKDTWGLFELMLLKDLQHEFSAFLVSSFLILKPQVLKF